MGHLISALLVRTSKNVGQKNGFDCIAATFILEPSLLLSVKLLSLLIVLPFLDIMPSYASYILGCLRGGRRDIEVRPSLHSESDEESIKGRRSR